MLISNSWMTKEREHPRFYFSLYIAMKTFSWVFIPPPPPAAQSRCVGAVLDILTSIITTTGCSICIDLICQNPLQMAILENDMQQKIQDYEVRLQCSDEASRKTIGELRNLLQGQQRMSARLGTVKQTGTIFLC